MNKHLLEGLNEKRLLYDTAGLLGLTIDDLFDLVSGQIMPFIKSLPVPGRTFLLDCESEENKLVVKDCRDEVYLGDITLSELFWAVPHPQKRRKIAVFALVFAITSGKLSFEMSKKTYV